MSYNNFTRRKAIAGVGAIAAGGMFAGFAKAEEGDLLAEIKKRGYIRVGTFNEPPECWIDMTSGRWSGFDADYVNSVAKSIGVEVDAIVIAYAALAPALDSGRLDSVIGMLKTPERLKVMDYTKNAMWYGPDVVVAQKDSSVKSLEDLKGKSLGTIRGSAQEVEAQGIKKLYGVGEIRAYEAADPMLLDVRAGRVDAGVWFGFAYDYAAKQKPGYDLKVVQYLSPSLLNEDKLPGAYPVFSKKGSASLIAAFDAEIERLHASGEGAKIMASYGLTDPSYVTGIVK